MYKIFRRKLTKKKELYRGKNFVPRALEFFSGSTVFEKGRTRLESDESIGQRICTIYIPGTSKYPESNIRIEEFVYDLPKRREGRRDYWGGEEKVFTWISIREISVPGSKRSKKDLQRGSLEDMLESPEFKNS